MTSKGEYSEAFVWIWLPGQTDPVVAGRVALNGEQLVFHYGRSYLQRQDAIPLYIPELPLRSGVIKPLTGLSMPGCLRDAAPDAWGRRVIINRKFGLRQDQDESGQLNELTYLLESGSDRIWRSGFSAVWHRLCAARRRRSHTGRVAQRG